MGTLNRWRTATTLLIAASSAALSGCLSTIGSDARMLAPQVIQPANLLAAAQVAPNAMLSSTYLSKQSLSESSAQVCAQVVDWVRPDEQGHMKQLEALPRYGDQIYEDPLKTLLNDFRSHQAITFTTYGLSARTEPLYMSGVWTAVDQLWSCYDGDQPQQINAGELAEVWLLNYRLVDLEPADTGYLMTVEPTETGMEVVQFARQEGSARLNLTVQTTAGVPVETFSGDW